MQMGSNTMDSNTMDSNTLNSNTIAHHRLTTAASIAFSLSGKLILLKIRFATTPRRNAH